MGAKRALPAVGGYLQAGLTAALNFEAIKPRIFNAIAVGEIHLTVAPSPKRIADAAHLKKPPRNVVAKIFSPLIPLPDTRF